jgi:putative flippase GtrA
VASATYGARIEGRTSEIDAGTLAVRLRRGVAHADNWRQLGRFAVVGASGYVVNLAVFWLAVNGLALDHRVAATLAFLVAVTNNFLWNRTWTFGIGHGRMHAQALRFLTVSVGGFLINLAVLEVLIAVGLSALPAQAIAVAVAMPCNFIANRLWTFAR